MYMYMGQFQFWLSEFRIFYFKLTEESVNCQLWRASLSFLTIEGKAIANINLQNEGLIWESMKRNASCGVGPILTSFEKQFSMTRNIAIAWFNGEIAISVAL